MTTIQDVIDRGRKYEKENVILREEISLKDTQIKDLESETVRMSFDLANAGLENERLSKEDQRLKELLKANNIAF